MLHIANSASGAVKNMLSITGNKSTLLDGKKITICVSGSVAAVRVPELARELIRHGADVRCVASKAALELVGELLLEWATGNQVVTSLTGKIEHVELGAYADLVLVCPATANTVSKIAQGIDDTPVTSTVTCAIGADKPVIIVPAMHESMYRHPIVVENIHKLKSIGVDVLAPNLTESKAKLMKNQDLVELVLEKLAIKDFEGARIVITAGPTYESFDVVRGITNLSSGKMGVELAKQASRRGADVVLVYGPGKVEPPAWIKVVKVVSGEQMSAAVQDAMRDADVLISAAAISDYQPVVSLSEKVNSGKELAIELKPVPKLVSRIRSLYPNKLIVGFKLEKDDLVEKAYQKLLKDGLDLIVANSIDAIGRDESDIHIIDRKKRVASFSGSKAQLSGFVLDFLIGVMDIRERANA